MLNKTTNQSERKLPSLNKVIVSKMDTDSIKNINGGIKDIFYEKRVPSPDTWTFPPTITLNIQ